MTDILFKCPNCSVALAADGESAGAAIECAKCGKPAAVPIPDVEMKCPACLSALSSSSILAGSSFACPCCGGTVPIPTRSGRRAPHGGDSSIPGSRSTRPFPVNTSLRAVPASQKLALGIGMLAVFLAAGAIALYLRPSRNPSSPKVSPSVDAPRPARSEAVSVNAALHSAILPEFEFRQAGLADVVEFLNKSFRDAAGKGGASVSFVLADRPAAGTGGSLPEVTLQGRNMRFDQVLLAVAEASGYSFETSNGMVRLSPAAAPCAIHVRCNKTDTDAMRALLARAIIPGVDFRQADINDIVAFLNAAFREHGPQGESASIVLMPRGKDGFPAAIPPVTMVSGPVSLLAVLEVVARIVRCEWAADGGMAVIRPSERAPLNEAAAFADGACQFQWGQANFNGWIGATNYEEAVYWYRKAADQGHAEAQFLLGYCCFGGKGVGRDYAEAVSWWQKSVAASNADARSYLGYCYLAGLGTPKDWDKGMSLLLASAEEGDDDAQLILGRAYYQTGIATNIEDALYWLAESASNGNSGAIEDLAAARKQIARKAFDVLGTKRNDPRFAGNGDLARVANVVVKLKERTSFPTINECDDLLEACGRILDLDLQDEVRRAVIGSRLLFEHEKGMLDKGYKRYAGAFMDEQSIALALEAQQQRSRESSRKPPGGQRRTSKRYIKEFGNSKDARGYVKALNNQAGDGPRYHMEEKKGHWVVYAIEKTTEPSTVAQGGRPSGHAESVRGYPTGPSDYRDYMRSTHGGRIGVTYNAGEFGPIINPGGFNW